MICGIVNAYLSGVDDAAGGHRYWRLYSPYQSSDPSGGTKYIGYGEIELIGASAVDLTSPAGAVSAASASTSAGSGLEAYQAFDDSTTIGSAGDYNMWEATNAAGAWIKYDFGTAKNITTVKIFPDFTERRRTPDCIYVQYSDDNSSWTTKWVFGARWDTAAWQTFNYTDANRQWLFNGTTDMFSAIGTGRIIVPATRFAGISGATKFRLGFYAAASPGAQISNVRVGHNTGAVTFQSSPTPVYATFGGGSSTSGVVSAGTFFETDDITFTLGSTDLCVAWRQAFDSPSYGLKCYDNIEGFTTGYRNGSDDTGNNSPSSGYTYPVGTNRCVIASIRKIA